MTAPSTKLSGKEREIIESSLANLGEQAGAELFSQLESYLNYLYKQNAAFNLTRVPREDAVLRHIVDSWSLLPLLKDLISQNHTDKVRIIDIGSGCGIPGLPLAMILPAVEVILVDALEKRCFFLEDCLALTGLKNVRVIHGRAEQLGRSPEHREHYTIATARAVAALPELLELLAPLVEVGGNVLAQKGVDPSDELAMISTEILSGLGLSGAESFSAERCNSALEGINLKFVKQSPTEERFPRLGKRSSS